MDATVSGTEKLKYNIGINESESESEYVIVKKLSTYYIGAVICQLPKSKQVVLKSTHQVDR